MMYNALVMEPLTAPKVPNAAEPLQWSVSSSGVDAVVALHGDLDLSNAQALQEFLQEVIEEHTPAKVVVDVERLSFLDSSGIRCFIHSAQTASNVGSKLTLRNASGRILRVLQLCGVDEILLDDSNGPTNRPNRDVSGDR
jgi:anti-sigma B factor antagonist